eukprot:1159359-Pelagomonas_calceolata.AAC.8
MQLIIPCFAIPPCPQQAPKWTGTDPQSSFPASNRSFKMHPSATWTMEGECVHALTLENCLPHAQLAVCFPSLHNCTLHSQTNPNARTVLAVAGEDYCIVAASTRMSAGFDIMTRQDSSKVLKLWVKKDL